MILSSNCSLLYDGKSGSSGQVPEDAEVVDATTDPDASVDGGTAEGCDLLYDDFSRDMGDWSVGTNSEVDIDGEALRVCNPQGTAVLIESRVLVAESGTGPIDVVIKARGRTAPDGFAISFILFECCTPQDQSSSPAVNLKTDWIAFERSITTTTAAWNSLDLAVVSYAAAPGSCFWVDDVCVSSAPGD